MKGGYQSTTGPPAGHSVIHKTRPIHRPPSTLAIMLLLCSSVEVEMENGASTTCAGRLWFVYLQKIGV